MKYRALLAVVLLGASLGASAKHLPVSGRTYDIVEPDFRAVLRQQLQRNVKPEMLQEKKEKALENYIARLPNYGLSSRTQARTRTVDVTQTLSRDVWAPHLDANGKITHKLMARKGDRLDPFATGAIPNSAFLIIDGTNPRHQELARQVHKWTPLVFIVLSKGDPRILAEELNKAVDYLQPQMMELFDLKTTPSFVWAEKKGSSGVVQVFEMAEPLLLADVQAKWKPVLTGTVGMKSIAESKNAADQKNPVPKPAGSPAGAR